MISSMPMLVGRASSQGTSELLRTTLSNQVAQHILEQAVADGLRPGNMLRSESQLAIDFKVSRPVVREALHLLAGQSAIEIINGKGAILRPPSDVQLQLYFNYAISIGQVQFHEIMEARKPIEVQSATLAAQRRTHEQIEKMEALIAKMKSQVHNADAYVDLDLELHLLIAEAAQNSIIAHLIHAIRSTLNTTVHESLYKRRNRQQLEWVHSVHEDLVQAIVLGNADAAGRAMHMHFDEALTFLNRQAGNIRRKP